MLINRSKATLGASTTVCFSRCEAEIFQLSFHLLATWTCSPIGRPALPDRILTEVDRCKKMNVTEKSPTCRKCGLFCTGQPGAGIGCRRSRWSEPARPLYSEMTLKMTKQTPNTCSPIPPYLFPPWWSSPPTPLPPLSYCSFSTLWTPPSETLRTLSRCWSDHFPHSLKVFFLRWPAAWGPSQP